MASQAEIQVLIDQIVTGGQYPANKMRPLLTSLNDYTNYTTTDPTASDDSSMNYIAMRSLWYNSSNLQLFLCLEDGIGAANWLNITPSTNADAASVIDVTLTELSNLITAGDVDIKAQYRITDSTVGVGIRVYGITPSIIDTNAFREGSYDGTNWNAGQVGLYDLSTDTFSPPGSVIPDLGQVYSQGNIVNGYDLTISGGSSDNIGITEAATFTGNRINAFGINAGGSNAGADINAMGSQAAASGLGTAINAFGNQAAKFSNATSLNAFGSKAAYNITSTVANINAFGESAAEGTTASHVNAIGQFAANGNTGADVNAIGRFAANGNTQAQVIAIGPNSLSTNIGIAAIGFGSNAGRLNTGNFCVFIGRNAGYNTVTAVGNTLASQFVIANASMPEYADITAAEASITVALGAVAGNTYLFYNTATKSIGAVRL